jgi:hypothetical protein
MNDTSTMCAGPECYYYTSILYCFINTILLCGSTLICALTIILSIGAIYVFFYPGHILDYLNEPSEKALTKSCRRCWLAGHKAGLLDAMAAVLEQKEKEGFCDEKVWLCHRKESNFDEQAERLYEKALIQLGFSPDRPSV